MSTPTSQPTVYAFYLNAYVSRLCDGTLLDAHAGNSPGEAELAAMALGSIHAQKASDPWRKVAVEAEVERMIRPA